MHFWLANEKDTRAAGAALALTLLPMAESAPVVVFVRGNLGAGKSTLVRGLLTQIGVEGVMPSPTYTLVEPYVVGKLKLFHMDAYRLADGAELDYLGLEEINEPGSVLLVEWPDQVRDALPPPSITLDLEMASNPNRRDPDKPLETIAKDGTVADPGRLLRVTLNAVPVHERECLFSQEQWSKFIRVVT